MDMEVDTEDDPPQLAAAESDSDTTSDCSESSSITNEIEQLIYDLEAIQRTHDLAIQQLQNVTALLSKSTSITVVVNGQMHDFCDIIDELHLQSLNEMGGEGFGKKILEWIDSAEIVVPNA
jgi:pyruvate dehydrogenase complex dehydrogenase (E1) component